MSNDWFQLIWNMCAEITKAYEEAGEAIDLVADQAKEKFGTLRFYWRSKSQKITFHAFDNLGEKHYKDLLRERNSSANL